MSDRTPHAHDGQPNAYALALVAYARDPYTTPMARVAARFQAGVLTRHEALVDLVKLGAKGDIATTLDSLSDAAIVRSFSYCPACVGAKFAGAR